jgi:hypothetical protein
VAERQTAANPEGWEGEADFAAEGTVGAMSVVGRGGLDLASRGEEDDCDEPWCCLGKELGSELGL